MVMSAQEAIRSLYNKGTLDITGNEEFHPWILN